MSVDQKCCKNCEQTKSKTEFSSKKAICRTCVSIRNKASYLAYKASPKKCKECNQTKTRADFSNRQSICKLCRSSTHKTQEEPLEEEQKQKQSDTVYLITSTTMKKHNRYKIGKHTGSLEKLKSRYHTYFPDLEVLRFWKVSDTGFHENSLHKLCAAYRVQKSEWFEFEGVPNMFDKYVRQYDDEYAIANLKDGYLELYMLNKELAETIKTQNKEKIQEKLDALFEYSWSIFD